MPVLVDKVAGCGECIAPVISLTANKDSRAFRLLYLRYDPCGPGSGNLHQGESADAILPDGFLIHLPCLFRGEKPGDERGIQGHTCRELSLINWRWQTEPDVRVAWLSPCLFLLHFYPLNVL